MSGPLRHLPSLDGCRALSIIAVLAFHWPSAHGGEALPNLSPLGEYGVRSFLVLSGFLITYLLLREADETGTISLRDFYIRRVARIFPVYYLFLLVLAILAVTGIGAPGKPLSWLASLTFTRNYVGWGFSATDHLWSLAVEEQFYLLWPITIAICLRRKMPQARIMLLLGFAALVSFVAKLLAPLSKGHPVLHAVFAGSSTLMFLDSLALGCMGAFLFRQSGGRAFPRGYFLVAAAGWLLTTLLTRFAEGAAVSCLITANSMFAAATIILSITSCPALVFTFLNSRIMVLLGTVSYSLYIWHVLFLPRLSGIRPDLFIFSWQVCYIAAFATACASYFLLEKPLLRLRDRFRHLRSTA